MAQFAPANIPLIGLDSVSPFRIDAESYGASPAASAALNTTAIQQALTAANTNGGAIVALMTPGTYSVSDTLWVYSNTKIQLGAGVKIQSATGTNKTLLRNVAQQGAQISISSLTSSSYTATAVTSTAHGLTTNDYVAVLGSSTQGYCGVFKVASVPTATSFTYFMTAEPGNATASANASGSTGFTTLFCYKADYGIEITGGIWDYNSANTGGAFATAFGLCIAYCYDAHVHDLSVINANKYAIAPACVQYFRATNISFDTPSGGVQMQGPIFSLVADGLYGRCDDQALAIGNSDYTQYLLSEGDIDSVVGRNIKTWASATATTTSRDQVRIFGKSPFAINEVVLDSCYVPHSVPFVKILADATNSLTTLNLRTLRISNLSGPSSGVTSSAILFISTGGTFTLGEVIFDGHNLHFATGGSVGDYSWMNCTGTGTVTWEALIITNCRITGNAFGDNARPINLGMTGGPKRIAFSNIQVTNHYGLLVQNSTTNANAVVSFDNCFLDSPSRLVQGAVSTEYHLKNVVGVTANTNCIRYTAASIALTVYKEGAVTWNNEPFFVSGAGSSLVVEEGGMRMTQLQITDTQIRAMLATPITLVAAPGSGKALVFLGAEFYLNPVTTGYTVGATSDFAIRYTNASGAIVGECETTGFMDQTTAQQRWVYPFAAGATSPLFSITPASNAVLVLNTLNADLTGGNASTVLNCRTWTKTIDLTWSSI